MTTTENSIYVESYPALDGEELTGDARVIFRKDSSSGTGALFILRSATGHCLVWYSNRPPSLSRGDDFTFSAVVKSTRIYQGTYQAVIGSVRIDGDISGLGKAKGQQTEDAWRTLMTSEAVEMKHVATVLGTNTRKLYAALRAAGVLARTDTGHAGGAGCESLFRVVSAEVDGRIYDKPLALPWAMPIIARAWVEHGRS